MARAARSDSKHARLAFVIAPLLAFGCGSDRSASDVRQERPGPSRGSAGSVNGGRFADAEGGQGGEAASGAQGHEVGAAGEAPTGRSNDGGASGHAGAPGGGAAGSAGMTDIGGSSILGGVGSSDTGAGAGGAAETAPAGGSGGAAGALGAAGAAGTGGFGGARPASTLPCEVQAVLKARCQACHQGPPVNGAPMRLLTWSDVYGKADEIYEKLSADEMPPPGAPDLSQDQASTLFTYLSLGTPAAGDVTCR